ncbi:MAG: GNAT family N-acetyltransferase [Marinobacter sp.]|nr:GNAT family N-acetyltransferase [Marinobacter sp.]
MHRCSTADESPISETLASAFADDPVMNWFQPDPTLVPVYFADVFKKQYLRKGYAWSAAEGQAAALWLPPGIEAHDPSLPYTARWAVQALKRKGPTFIWQAWHQKQAFSDKRPLDDWYLHAIGVHARAQGQGYGAKLLGETLAWIDDHQPAGAWLENSNPQNLGLYQRFGFKVLDTHDLSPEGPRLWLMRREPGRR